MKDRRAELRFPVHQPVQLTLLDDSNHQFEATITEVSGRGMRIVAHRALPLSAPVRLDLDDSLVLGEVCYCSPDGDKFVIGLQLQHSLLRLAELADLRSQWVDEATPTASRTR
jgi:hypothetical protein